MGPTAIPDSEYTWNLLSNYAHVLICLAMDPRVRLRDVANVVGITERTVQRIVTELEHANILSRKREGRRNRYRIHIEQRMRHPLESHYTIGSLLETVTQQKLR